MIDLSALHPFDCLSSVLVSAGLISCQKASPRSSETPAPAAKVAATPEEKAKVQGTEAPAPVAAPEPTLDKKLAAEGWLQLCDGSTLYGLKANSDLN